MENNYTILGVTKSATKDEIRSAYVRLARDSHPDVGGNAGDFLSICGAYKVLSNPSMRKAYDEYLAMSEKPCPKCAGKGILVKQRTFKERTIRPCDECKGAGFVERSKP